MTTTELRNLGSVGPMADVMRLLDEHDVKFEVLDGVITVMNPPAWFHQRALTSMLSQLAAAAPRGWHVGWDHGYAYADGSYVIPDITVLAPPLPRHGLDGKTPALIVEASSPSTWRADEGRKKEIYRDGGVVSYWLVDPDEPRLRVLELLDGEYAEVAGAGPGESVTRDLPYPVTVTMPVWDGD